MLQNVLLVKLTKLSTINFLFQLCTCSEMCLLLNCKIVHCELHVFSFSFVHAPICANCKNDSCNIYSKKKKKKKNDLYFGMGEKYQSYATKTLLSIFSLGKGRESLHLQTLHKKLSKSALSALPIILIQTLCGRRTPKLTKIDQVSSLCRSFRTFSVTEGYTICHSISSSQPQQESSPTE